MPEDIRTLFAGSDLPAPTDTLRARILADVELSAALAPPANDNRRTGWAIFSAIAATLVIGVFAATAMFDEPQEDWESYADAAGFTDLYAWVEGE